MAPAEAPATQPEAAPKEEATAPDEAPAGPFAAEEAFGTEMLLIVDAANGFNNLSKPAMIWTMTHRCPWLVTYAFNRYTGIRLVSSAVTLAASLRSSPARKESHKVTPWR